MKSTRMNKGWVVAVVFLLVVGLGTWATAETAKDKEAGPGAVDCPYAAGGKGMGMGMGHGPMGGMGGHGCMGMGANVSPETAAKFDEERTAFWNETKELRSTMVEKRAELNLEFSRKEPNADKAKAVQKELSDLESQLDQRRIDHVFRMKKIDPSFIPGCMGGGPGMHKGMKKDMKHDKGHGAHKGQPM